MKKVDSFTTAKIKRKDTSKIMGTLSHERDDPESAASCKYVRVALWIVGLSDIDLVSMYRNSNQSIQ